MLWKIVCALLFVFIGLPVLFYVIASLCDAIGAAFRSIIEFPNRVIQIYKKGGTKGVLKAFRGLVVLFVYVIFMMGGMCMGIAMFAKTKVAPYTYVPAYTVDPYGALFCGGLGLLLMAVAIFIGLKLYKAVKTK